MNLWERGNYAWHGFSHRGKPAFGCVPLSCAQTTELTRISRLNVYIVDDHVK